LLATGCVGVYLRVLRGDFSMCYAKLFVSVLRVLCDNWSQIGVNGAKLAYFCDFAVFIGF
jgi:hypothetical protein